MMTQAQAPTLGGVTRELCWAPPAQLLNGVRHAIKTDARDLAWIRALSWQVAFEQGLLASQIAPRDLEVDTRRWARRIARGAFPVMVGLREGRTVGYAAFACRQAKGGPSRARIDSLHVDPVFWHSRVADNLVTAVCDWASQHTSVAVEMCVMGDNPSAHELLSRNAFVVRGKYLAKGRLFVRFERTFT